MMAVNCNKLSERGSSRIIWIDALKGFLIFCVTFGHCHPAPSLEKYIYSFHMFTFFFLSGYVFNVESDSKKMILNCVKKLLVPFFVWNTISSLIDLCKYRDFTLFVEELFVVNGKLTSNPPIWFLLVLFIAEIIFILLRLHKHPLFLVSGVIICLILWSVIGNMWLLWKLNLVPMALCFFLFGYAFKPSVSKINKWYFIVLFFGVNLFFALQNIRIIYTYGEFGNLTYCVIAAVSGTLFYVGLFSSVKFISRIKILSWLGKNSLMIMATQYYIFMVCEAISVNYFEISLMKPDNILISFLFAIITISLISVAVHYIKKLTCRNERLRSFCILIGINYS